MEFHVLQFVSIVSCPFTRHHGKKSVTPPSLLPSIRYLSKCIFYTHIWNLTVPFPPPWGFSSPEQCKLAPSIPPVRFFKPLINFVALCWTHPSACFVLRSKEVDKALRICLNRAAQTGKNTSFNLRALLFLMHRMLLTSFATRVNWWVMLNFTSTNTPGQFLQSCFPAGQPGSVLMHGVIPPTYKTSFFSVNFMRYLSAHN